MPYIEDQQKRIQLDIIVKEMAGVPLRVDGDLNYLLFAYCKRCVVPSYNNYKNFLGELDEVRAEIRRRLLAGHEDNKISENGDVE